MPALYRRSNLWMINITKYEIYLLRTEKLRNLLFLFYAAAKNKFPLGIDKV